MRPLGFLSLLSCTLLVAHTLVAQDPALPVGILSGQVLDPSGKPVNLAEVTVVASDRTTLTDKKGTFRFTDVPIGVTKILVRSPSYADRTVEVMVRAGAALEAKVTMAQGATTMLPEIEVVGEAERPEEFRDTHKYDDYFRRKKLGSGVYIERAEIEKMGATDVLGVLRGIPGVRATMEMSIYGAPFAKLSIARCPGTPPPIAIYLDGLRVSIFLGDRAGSTSIEGSLGLGKAQCPACEALAETLSLISIRDVEFVEFYRGVAQIPGDLDRTGNCAVLALWTRQ